MAEQSIRISDIARLTGIPESIIDRRVDSKNIDASSLRWNDETGKISARTHKGGTQLFYTTKNQNGQNGMFGTKSGLEHAAADNWDADNYHSDSVTYQVSFGV